MYYMFLWTTRFDVLDLVCKKKELKQFDNQYNSGIISDVKSTRHTFRYISTIKDLVFQGRLISNIRNIAV